MKKVKKLKQLLNEAINDKVGGKFIQWAQDDTGFNPVGKINLIPEIKADTYRIQSYPSLKFIPTKSKTDSLLVFRESSMDKIVNEIKTFWKLKENFNKLGFLHNRGILIYGPPGSGKSSLLQQVSEQQKENGDITIFSHGLGGLQNGLRALREIEQDRRLVVVLEDIDGYNYDERELLQLLDGENNVDNVLYLATTNYKNKISERLMRPGRFDKQIYIGYPDLGSRITYLEAKLKNVETKERIKEIAKRTENFSFGHLRELVIGAYAFKESIEDTINRLKKHRGIN